MFMDTVRESHWHEWSSVETNFFSLHSTVRTSLNLTGWSVPMNKLWTPKTSSCDLPSFLFYLLNKLQLKSDCLLWMMHVYWIVRKNSTHRHDAVYVSGNPTWKELVIRNLISSNWLIMTFSVLHIPKTRDDMSDKAYQHI